MLDNLDVGANIFLRREPTFGSPLKLIDRKRILRSDEILKRLGVDVSSALLLVDYQSHNNNSSKSHALSVRARGSIIMDEPTSSLTLTGNTSLARADKGSQGRQRQHHLHLAPHARS